jgi:sugar phosphate isomerase/epimerase
MAGYNRPVYRQPLAHLLEELLNETSDDGLEVILVAAASVPPAEREAVDAEYRDRYTRAVRSVAQVRGAPTFSGQPGELGYPEWHRAPWMTTWANATGIVYVALGDLDGGPAIVAGARPHPYERETITLLPPGD